MYANAAGAFADFTLEKNRPPHFTWDWFVAYCERNADLWLMTYEGKKPSDERAKLAKEFAKEIAETLVWHVTK